MRGTRGTLDTRFYRFPSEFGLPVTGALMTDEPSGYVTLGVACRADLVAAMRKALAEAAQQQMVVRDLDDPASAIARVAERPHSPVKPWRRDRAYRGSYRPDWRDVVDPGCHLQLYLDPRLRTTLEAELAAGAVGPWPWTHSIVTDPPAASIPADPVQLLAHTAGLLAAEGMRVYSVDVTTDDVRSAGLHVVRLVVPGMYSNAPAAFPFLGGRRLARLLQSAPMSQPRLLPLAH